MRNELAAFVAARLDEAEDAALTANSSVWPSREVQVALDDPEHHAWRAQELSPTMARHIVLHGPPRALREVAFGRALLEDYESGLRQVGDGLSVRTRRLVVAYAGIWADHPDYGQAITCSHAFYDYDGDKRCVTCGTVVKQAASRSIGA